MGGGVEGGKPVSLDEESDKKRVCVGERALLEPCKYEGVAAANLVRVGVELTLMIGSFGHFTPSKPGLVWRGQA